jgi:hypothetical protein
MTEIKGGERSGWMPRRRLLAIGAVLLLGLLAAQPAVAGGDAFTAEVLDFRALGNDEYRIVLRQLTGLYGSDEVPAEPLVIHLRHDEDVMRRAPKDLVSRENYLEAIELLKQQIAQSKTIEFGVIGGMGGRGILPPTDDEPGVHQSYSLSIIQPPYPKPGAKSIVFAWPRPA